MYIILSNKDFRETS